MLNVNAKMSKEEIIKAMEDAGMVFSRDLSKKELVAFAQAQQTQSEEEMTMTEENVNVNAEAAIEDATTATEEIVTAPAEAPEVTNHPLQDEPPAEDAVEVLEDGKDVVRNADGSIDTVAVDPENATAEQIAAVEKENTVPETNKRKVGKGVMVLKNGEAFAEYPSIKATALAFKELLGLKHMPFTPIMKSVRQGIDWNEYSFFIEGMGPSADDAQPVEETAAEGGITEVKDEEIAAPSDELEAPADDATTEEQTA